MNDDILVILLITKKCKSEILKMQYTGPQVFPTAIKKNQK